MRKHGRFVRGGGQSKAQFSLESKTPVAHAASSASADSKSGAFHVAAPFGGFGNSLRGRLLILLLAAVFLFFGILAAISSVFSSASTADENGISYIEYTWDEDTSSLTKSDGTRNAGEYTVITADTTSWGTADSETWYAVVSTVEISERVTVSGDVHLILADGASLTIDGGIHLPKDNSLAIYGQTKSTGKLVANSNNSTNSNGSIVDAVIGGNTGETAGDITIHGGNIESKGGSARSGGYRAAVVGGGRYGSGGTVTINGGSLSVSGGSTTYSDEPVGNPSYVGAVVGGGESGGSGTITVNGGSLTANGGTAARSYLGAVVGGGSYGSGTITVNGGILSATSGRASLYHAAVVGHGYGSSGGATVSVSGGALIADSNGNSMSAVSASSFTLAESYLYKWRTSSSGEYTAFDETPYTYSSGHRYVELAEDENAVPYVYYTWDADEQQLTEHNSGKAGGSYTLLTSDNAATSWGSGDTETWYVVDSEVTISSRVTVTGDVHLVLVNGSSLTVTGGIGVPDSASFTVYGQTDDETEMGQLTATTSTARYAAIGGTGATTSGNSGEITIHGGNVTAETSGSNAAGIGSTYYRAAGAITIYGGTVTATGGSGGAGIGGGYGTYGSTSSSSVESITIYGGTVTATGGIWAAGIGSGRDGSAESITIYGGTVTTKGGTSGAGIGSAYDYSSAGSITINGGTVEATGGGNSAGIGSGNQGSVESITINGGTVTSTGGQSGAGIGSGNGSSASDVDSVGSIEITGGTVNATGGDHAAGIGAGQSSLGPTNVASISISGGIITAEGGKGTRIGTTGISPGQGIGIGGNEYSAVGSVEISGGYFTLTAGTNTDGSTVAVLNAAAVVSGGVFADGTLVSLSGAGRGTVYDVTPVEGYYVLENTDSNSARKYPFVVLQVSVTAGTISGLSDLEGKTYDGAPLDFSAASVTGAYGTLQVTGESESLQVACYAQTGTDSDDNPVWSSEPVDCASLVNAGSYQVTASLTGGVLLADGEAVDMVLDRVTGAFTGSANLAEVTAYVGTSAETVVNIGAKTVTAVVSGDASKTYDGTKTVLVEDESAFSTLAVSLTDVLDTDQNYVLVSSDSVSYEYTTANAGINTVTVKITGLSGAKAGNYKLAESEITYEVKTGITPKPVTAVVSRDASKTYDGTTAIDSKGATSSLSVSLSGVLGVDEGKVQLADNAVSYEYESANAGTNTVKVAINDLSGDAADNYKLAESAFTYEVASGIGQATPVVEVLETTEVIMGTNPTVVSDQASVLGVDGSDLPGAWGWSGQDGSPVDAISVTPGSDVVLTWVFTPEDTTNYESVSGTTTFSVVAVEVTVDIEGLPDKVEPGTGLDLVTENMTVTDSNGDEVSGSWSWTDQDGNPVTTVTGTPGSEVTLVWTFTPDDPAYETVTGTVTFEIADETSGGQANADSGTSGGTSGGTNDSGNTEDLAKTGTNAMLALVTLALLAGLGGITLVARKHS